VPGELAAAAGTVGADQHRLVSDGQLGQGEVDQLDKVAGRARSGVAWPQQARQRLTRRLPAVQVGQQRGEPNDLL